MLSLKQQLYDLCNAYIMERKTSIRKAIGDMQEASANETKSSAGDKYETGREMMQQEINMNLSRLNELQMLQTAMDLIDPAHVAPVVVPGSLVETDQGNYYISISAGKLNIAGINYFAISAASPVGRLLLAKGKGDRFDFNGKRFIVLKVH